MQKTESLLRVVRAHSSLLKRLRALPPARVLIVDDQQSVLDFVRRVLDGAGYNTAVAASGREALRAVIERGAPDLLLTDLKMPGMDGDELAAKLRYENPDLRVLYLTGFSGDLFTRKAALWEGEAFLDKPCTVQGLLEAVAMALCGHLMPDHPDKSRRH